MRFILASASPRRRQMFEDLSIQFEVEAPQVDESRLQGESAAKYVSRIAKIKAEEIYFRNQTKFQDRFAILAADTTVKLNSKILGKPKDADEAFSMLKMLSGKTHEVLTAYFWLGFSHGILKSKPGIVTTKVTFEKNEDSFWKWYSQTKEPLDKAGAYAAQGMGMAFIKKVTGSYSNVVGLPLAHVLTDFQKLFGSDLYELCRKS